MISIGAVYRGPELSDSPFQQAVRAAAKVLNAARGELTLGAVPVVNAVFVVPGSLGGTGFEGLNFGQYSKKDKAVVVQIPVPLEVVETVPASFIKDALHGANAMAFEFFRQKGDSFPLSDAEALVGLLAPNRG
jgi:hypothetical protein